MTRDELLNFMDSNCRGFTTFAENLDAVADALISQGLVTVTEPWKPQAGHHARWIETNKDGDIRRQVRLIGEVPQNGGWHWIVQSVADGSVHLARPDQLSQIKEN
jgi:hypothetical protein